MESRSGAEEAALVETFVGVTSATPEEARFFLESHNWLLDSAIHSFYETSPSSPFDPHPAEPRGAGGAADGNGDGDRDEDEDGDGGGDDDDDDDEDYVPENDDPPPVAVPVVRSTSGTRSRGEKRPATEVSRSRPTIRTLADLNRRAGPGSDSDSDGPQEYYTGGEKSGMLVQDPSKGGHDVDAIFAQARQMGAIQGPFEPQPSSSTRSFTGTGRLLSGETVPSAPQQPQNVVHTIYFWSNGFTVNDGPLRRFDDPENASFLESVRKSELPKELEPSDRRTTVHVNLVRKEEKCPEPVKRRTPFRGVGRTLGSGSSNNSVFGPAVAAAIPSTVPSPSVGLSVDASLPSTSIQLRLVDGTRMVARFNTHHTIGDIRAFIDASRPGAARNYQLQTVGFPPKQLTDDTQTIEEAGLGNSVVIQKF